MNFKKIFSSWFGLGILMFLLQYPINFLLKLLGGGTEMNLLAILLSGMVSAALFTYCIYPHIMSPKFKVAAILTTLCISVVVMILILKTVFNLTITMNTVTEILQRADFRITSLLLIGFLIQLGVWYLFVTLGNKQAVKTLQTTNK
jgi:hypothetical protein